VPFVELYADDEVTASILGKPLNHFSKVVHSKKEWENKMFDYIKISEMLGYDYIRADVSGYIVPVKSSEENHNVLDVGEVGSRVYRYKTIDVARELNRGERQWANEGTGVISNWKDFENYKWENPEDIEKEGNEGLEWMCDHVPKGMGVVAGSGNILEPVMWMMGIKNFYTSLYKQPDLVNAMFQKLGEINLTRFKLAADTSKKIVAFWGSDDWGYKNGLMISPDMMRRWVFPVHKKMAEIAHSKGSLYILHSCGDLSEVMDDIIDDVKIDAKHSFEDTYLPVTLAKNLYGHRIGLIGGVDMDFLSRQNPNAVKDYVSNILEICMPDGGYCLGSGNTVANYVPLENYLTMLLTGLEKGWYN
jgi:uroporphyrinogen decarboxylase